MRLLCDLIQVLDVGQLGEGLRHDDVAAADKMGSGHGQRDRSQDRVGILGRVLPPAD